MDHSYALLMLYIIQKRPIIYGLLKIVINCRYLKRFFLFSWDSVNIVFVYAKKGHYYGHLLCMLTETTTIECAVRESSGKLIRAHP